jgi:hypothetical protein
LIGAVVIRHKCGVAWFPRVIDQPGSQRSGVSAHVRRRKWVDRKLVLRINGSDAKYSGDCQTREN